MSQNNRYALTFETLAELSTEIRSTRADLAPVLPKLSEVLAQISPLPHAGLFLGLANDGWPVLLNLLEPTPGPLLILGDKGSGKTKLLQTVSQSIEHLPPSQKIKYVLFTNYPDEWNSLQFQNCDGILSIANPESARYLGKLVEWAHAYPANGQTVVLLFDDFEALISSNEIRQYLRWLFLRGPSHQVWPLVTLNAEHTDNLSSWLGMFHTRLYGCIENQQTREILTGQKDNCVHELIRGSQFAMRDGESWLPFWIPRLG
jgi:energy-coupling factor transporter ATP-binding protein EcfA2